MMKKTKKKKVIITLAILTLVTATYIIIATYFSLWPFQPKPQDNGDIYINLEEASPEQKKAGNATAEHQKNPVQSSEQSQDTTPNMEVTALNQTDDVLIVRTMIHTLKPGTCTLSLTHPSYAEITKTANTQTLANVSTCQGFDVARSELQPGEWKLRIEYQNEHTSGSVERVVNVE